MAVIAYRTPDGIVDYGFCRYLLIHTAEAAMEIFASLRKRYQWGWHEPLIGDFRGSVVALVTRCWSVCRPLAVREADTFDQHERRPAEIKADATLEGAT